MRICEVPFESYINMKNPCGAFRAFHLSSGPLLLHNLPPSSEDLERRHKLDKGESCIRHDR